MTFVQELISRINDKNSWGKNELIALIADLMAKHFGGLK